MEPVIKIELDQVLGGDEPVIARSMDAVIAGNSYLAGELMPVA